MCKEYVIYLLVFFGLIIVAGVIGWYVECKSMGLFKS